MSENRIDTSQACNAWAPPQGGTEGTRPPQPKSWGGHHVLYPPQSWWFRSNRVYPSFEASSSLQCMSVCCSPNRSFISPLMKMFGKKHNHRSIFVFTLHGCTFLLPDRFRSLSASMNSVPHHSTFGVVSRVDHR